MKLRVENVRIIEKQMLDELDLYGAEGKDAEKLVNYISGVQDMANAVIQAIHDLEK